MPQSPQQNETGSADPASLWEHTVDVIVVGSGGGGMTAAITAHDAGRSVLILEKADRVGGTTALSGGAIWVPNHSHQARHGIDDNHDDAWKYVQATVGKRVPEERLRAYLDSAPAMVDYLEANTRVQFSCLTQYPDYYPDKPGARPGGRALEATPYDLRKLGSAAARLHPPHIQVLIGGELAATAPEARVLLAGGFKSILLALRIFAMYLLRLPARLKFGRDVRLTLGNALAARLYHSLLDRNLPVWTSTRVVELVVDEGVVTGVVVERSGRKLRLRARYGVILAAGGFARNAAMRKQYQPAPVLDAWTATNDLDSGDAIRMGLDAGAAVDLMDDAWWTPTLLVPERERPYLLVVEKSLPGSILVGSDGRRFVNEAAPYVDVVKAMLAGHAAARGTVPAWLIMDHEYRKRYPLGALLPQAYQPKWTWSQPVRAWIRQARTLAELADQCGIDRAALLDTVAAFNVQAARGRDPEFGRGNNAYDRYYGDPKVHPNPNLRAVDRGPFYAVQVWPGDLGTKGGLVTDADARVLDQAGRPIAGLFATGNCSASVMGHTYPGAGGTIGPAMVFGYRAARFIVAQAAEPAGRVNVAA